MASIADIRFYYSGGAGNSTPSLSIGGAISATAIPLQTLTSSTAITGVTLNEGFGNAEGAGTLTWNSSLTTFTWRPYNGTAGTAVEVTADGDYFIQGAGTAAGGIAITVDYSALPTSTASDSITVANYTEKWFASQTKPETSAGVTKYHCFAIKNNHATDNLVDLRLYIAQNTNAEDTWELYLDPLAASNGSVGPTAVADENTAPVGATWVNPTSYDHADYLAVGELTPGQCRFFWVKQTTPANCTTSVTENIAKIGIYVKG